MAVSPPQQQAHDELQQFASRVESQSVPHAELRQFAGKVSLRANPITRHLMDAGDTESLNTLDRFVQKAYSGKRYPGYAGPTMQNIPVVDTAIESIAEAGKHVASTVTRPFGALSPRAQQISDQFAAEADKISRMRADRTGGGLPTNILSSSVQSLTQAGLMSPAAAAGQTGQYLMAGGFGAIEANQAYSDGRRAGLSGDALHDYVTKAFATEALVSSVFSAVGLGGFEKTLTGQSASAGLLRDLPKAVGKTSLQEIPEEIITESLHSVNRAYAGVDPQALDWEQYKNTLYQTVGSTLLTVGLAETGRFVATPSRKNYDALPEHHRTLGAQPTQQQRQKLAKELSDKINEVIQKQPEQAKPAPAPVPAEQQPTPVAPPVAPEVPAETLPVPPVEQPPVVDDVAPAPAPEDEFDLPTAVTPEAPVTPPVEAPVEQPAETVPAKQPWEMTLLDFAKSKLPPSQAAQVTDAKQVESFRAQHKRDVQGWINAGKTVPPEVLADYPDLQKPVEPQPEAVDEPWRLDTVPLAPEIAETPSPPKPQTPPPRAPIALTDTLQQRIAKAGIDAAKGRTSVRVRIADIRDSVHDVERDTLDRMLLQMEREGKLTLYRLDDPAEITKRDKGAELRTPTGQERHIIYFDERIPHALVTPPPGLSTPPGPPQSPPTAPPAVPQPTESAPAGTAATLPERVASHLKTGEPLNAKQFWQYADEAYGGTRAEGKYQPSQAYDELELGVNRFIRDNPEKFRTPDDASAAIRIAAELQEFTYTHLPSQTNRSGEKETLQQFSTPPAYAFAATWVANIGPGDVVLEPSAGTGGLAVHAINAGAEVYGNEISQRRADLLSQLNPAGVFTEDAEQIHNTLHDKMPPPSVVVMNPPFSHAGKRMGDKKIPGTDLNHIDAALQLLQPNGRLVAIIGAGLHGETQTFRKWLLKTRKTHIVRAIIDVGRSIYKGYGTTFPTKPLVIDKRAHAPFTIEAIESPGVAAQAFKGGDRVQWVDPIRGLMTGTVVDNTLKENSTITVQRDGESHNTLVSPLRLSVNETTTGTAETVHDLLRMLEGVRNARVSSAQQQPTQPTRPEAPPKAEAGTQPAIPVRTPVGGVGTGGKGQRNPQAEPTVSGRPAVDRPADDATEKPTASDAGPADGGTGSQDAATGSQQTGATAPKKQPGDTGRKPDREPALEPEPEEEVVSGGDQPRLETESPKKREGKPKKEVRDTLFEDYRPPKIKIKGSKPHPAKIVEPAAMAAVDPPDPTYSPSLPREVVTDGLLSEVQLESVVYAGQAHQQFLPHGENETPVRRGILIGDGTGLGKGRTSAGIILDNWQQGRKKAVWVSATSDLLKDARRDWQALGGNKDDVFAGVKAGSNIDRSEGIYYLTYSTLGKSAKPGQKSRVDQVVEWFGDDYDGVIVFDESHKMGNATGEPGKKVGGPSAMAMAGLDVQARLPNARVVYLSATAATEVENLAYAERLGLWGRGTAFADRMDFINKIKGTGIAAMEMVAHGMKAAGSYLSRNISYDGVTRETLVHNLTEEQSIAYDRMAEAYQVILNNIDKALEMTNGGKQARKFALSAFWSSQQRFFSTVITSLQTPAVVNRIEKDLDNGKSVVIQITSTGEAQQERELTKRRAAAGDEEMDLEDFSTAPIDEVKGLVEKSFPVHQYESFIDDNGNKGSRLVLDSSGKPVVNREAVALRDKMLEDLESLRSFLPDSPIDMIVNHFGTDTVAEVTGRRRRVVREEDDKGRMRRVVQKLGKAFRKKDAAEFQSGRKRVLIFSEAGGTGSSYHAEVGSGNEQHRIHYLLQAGWRAATAMQGLGRTHRSNQASTPHYVLVSTNLKGQKRFISSISRRLSQLGAITKGQTGAASGGMFSDADNLESAQSTEALQDLLHGVFREEIEGITREDFEKQTGIILTKSDGGPANTQNIPVTRFLNRLLSLKIDMQNLVFEAFENRLIERTEQARQAGRLNEGMQALRADSVSKVTEQVVYTDPSSGAETKYVKLNVQEKITPTHYQDAINAAGRDLLGFLRSKSSGRIYAAVNTGATETDPKTGSISRRIRLIAPDRREIRSERTLTNKQYWEELRRADAKGIWDAYIENMPEFAERDVHMLTGNLLPIWDRMVGNVQIRRTVTDEGEDLLGRIISDDNLERTLGNLAVERKQHDIDLNELAIQLPGRSNVVAELANGWKISGARVQGERRIEITGPSFMHERQLQEDGVLREVISSKPRYFIPVGDKTVSILRSVTEGANRPIVRVTKDGGEDTASLRGNVAEKLQESADVAQEKFEDEQKRMGAFLGGLGTSPRPRGASTVEQQIRADDDEVEQRLQDAHGVQPLGTLERIRRASRQLWHKITRVQEHLAGGGENAWKNEFFRLLRAIPNAASDDAYRTVAAIVDPLGEDHLKVFERKLVYENLLASVAAGQPLRFGFTNPQQIESELAKLDQLIEQPEMKPVKQALEAREAVRQETVKKLVDAGLLPDNSLANDKYYHQQVLTHLLADNRVARGATPRPMKRSFQKKRVEAADIWGQEYDYNTSYIEAESKWLTDAQVELRKNDLIEKYLSKRDRLAEFRQTATERNFETLVGGKAVASRIYSLRGDLAESLASEDRNDSAERMRRKQIHEELEKLDPTEPFRQRMGKMAAIFRKKMGMATDGEFDDESSDLMAEMTRIANLPEEHDAKPAALGFLKAVNERREFIRTTLGDRYVDWKDVLRENAELDAWQPRPGNVFYRAFTVPEKIAEQLQQHVISEFNLTEDDLREVTAVGAQRDPMILPKDMVAQLNETKKVATGPLAQLAADALGSWKIFTLLNPKRAAAYMARNVTGDLDPIIGGAPGVLQHTNRAIGELHRYHSGKLALSRTLRTARDLAVVDSSMTAEDIPDIKDIQVFRRLYGPDGNKQGLVSRYFSAVSEFNSFRENILRYAAFLYYRDALTNGTLKHYGGANRAVVDALAKEQGVDTAAAHLARNLMGDYGNITVLGNWLRRYLVPFWSFQEINLKRYPRLFINAVSAGDPKSAGLTGVAASAALTMRVASMYAAYWVWNNLFMGDDEEELNPYDRANPHINLGRNADGSIRVFRNVGALGDFLEWFGLNDVGSLFRQWEKDQITAGDAAIEMGKAPFNKITGGLRPDLKLMYELPSGTSLFPDAFSPRAEERGTLLAGVLGLQDELEWVKGVTLAEGDRVRPHYWQRTVLGVSDPRKNALSEMYDLRDKFLAKKGADVPTVLSISAYKNMREAAQNEDYEAFKEAKQALIERGKTYDQFRSSIGAIGRIVSSEDAPEFEKFLDSDQRARYKVARDYAASLQDLTWQWWEASEREGVSAESADERVKHIGSLAYTATGSDKQNGKDAAARILKARGIPDAELRRAFRAYWRSQGYEVGSDAYLYRLGKLRRIASQ